VRLLVTRPEPECERTAQTLREHGHEVLVLPLLRIEAVPDAALGAGPWGAVLFTSTNAVRALAAHRRFAELSVLPAYAVGARTKAAAAAVGFVQVRSADGDIDDLAQLIVAEPPDNGLPLLYAAGRERAGDLKGALRAHGLMTETVVVYRTVMVEHLPEEVRVRLEQGEIEGVLHYSARTAAAFLAAANAAGINHSSIRIKHFCLSAAVAAPLVAAGLRSIDLAQTPDEPALLAQIGMA
jgi:uroporphyrinogen-III synthase